MVRVKAKPVRASAETPHLDRETFDTVLRDVLTDVLRAAGFRVESAAIDALEAAGVEAIDAFSRECVAAAAAGGSRDGRLTVRHVRLARRMLHPAVTTQRTKL